MYMADYLAKRPAVVHFLLGLNQIVLSRTRRQGKKQEVCFDSGIGEGSLDR